MDEETPLPEKFKLDRKKIQTATLVDDNDEINQLGLSIFNQADLEQGDCLRPARSAQREILLSNRSDRSSGQCRLRSRTSESNSADRKRDSNAGNNDQVVRNESPLSFEGRIAVLSGVTSLPNNRSWPRSTEPRTSPLAKTFRKRTSKTPSKIS